MKRSSEGLVFVEAFELMDMPESKNNGVSFSDSVGSQPLTVRIAATHSGMINSNFRRYNPEGMKRSVSTWTENYSKPVLLHHDTDTKDPIGRVIDAEYIDLTYGTGVVQGNQPAGYIQLYAKISDPDAVQKITDGRYQTVSVGFAAKSVHCSICGQDLAADGMCEHVKGEMYEDKVCFWDVSDINYKEVSFVNVPADSYAKIVGVDNDPIKRDHSDQQFKDSATLKVLYTNQEVDSMRFNFADSASGVENNPNDGINYSDADFDLIDWLNQQMAEDKDGILGDAKLSAAARKDLPASAFCGKKDRSFPVPDCAHVTAALRLLPRYKGESDKSAIRACIQRKAKSMGCKSSDAYSRSDEENTPDSVFCLVGEVDGKKVRAYPADSVENLIKSIVELGHDYSITPDIRKTVHAALVTRGKEMGIKVEDWDPETQDEIKYTKLALCDASLEDILALAIVKDHMKGYVTKDSVPEPGADSDEITQKAFKAMKDEIAALESKISELTDEVETRKDEAHEAAVQSTDLLKQIHRNLAEKVAIRQYQLGKPQMKSVNSRDEFEEKIIELAKRDKASLEFALTDLEQEQPLFHFTDKVTKTDDGITGNDDDKGSWDKNQMGKTVASKGKDQSQSEKDSVGSLLGIK